MELRKDLYHSLNQNRKPFLSTKFEEIFSNRCIWQSHLGPGAESVSGFFHAFCGFYPKVRKESKLICYKHETALECVTPIQWEGIQVSGFFSHSESHLVWGHQLSNPKIQQSHSLITI